MPPHDIMKMMCHINLPYVFSLDEGMNERERERVKNNFYYSIDELYVFQ